MNTGSSQLSSLLTDTVRMLCQNTVEYSESLRIQGLLVVTADSNRVHVIEISDMFPSAQSTGVGSSGLCETETEVPLNDYKPPIPMPAQDFPAHSATSQQEMVPSFRTKAPGVRGRGGFHTVKPPLKRRGGFVGFPPASKRSLQRIVPRTSEVKMEDPIILDDSPDDTANMAGDMNMIEPKVESGWADAVSDYQNVQQFPDEGDVPGYHGTDMQLYGNIQSSQPRRRRRSATAAHTVTSSDGINEQSALAYDGIAPDMKPHHLNYGGEQGADDGGQSFLSPVGKNFFILLLCNILLMYYYYAGAAPAYLADDCRLLSDADRRLLRSNSNDMRKLVVPRTHNKLGDSCFSAAGPRLWNDLPPGLWRPGLSFRFFQTISENSPFWQLKRLVTFDL